MALYLNSTLFRNTFSTPEMREIFDEAAFCERFMRVEAALARAEARAGLVPEAAAEEITAKADVEYLDDERLEELIAETGHSAMTIIGTWKEAFGEAGEYIHWGATSQDVLDTAVVLQIRDATDVLRRDLEAIRERLVDLADEYRGTPTIGRTHFVHAIPTTFGLKLSVWIREIDRHLDRLADLEDRVFAGQFFGATGTLASLGEDGLEVQRLLAEELDLPMADVVWHAARDRFAEIVSVLAMIASTLGKIARRILFLHRPEVDEAQEIVSEGHIGSSTMPHKRNPKKSEGTVMLARLVRDQSRLMNEASETVDERDATTWYAEFALVPNAFLYSSRMTANVLEVLESLEVRPDSMRENLGKFGGLVASERIMMALADELGRQTAHDVVAENAWIAMDDDRPFAEVLLEDGRVTDVLTEADVRSLLDAAEYTGLAERFVDRTVDSRPE